VQRLDHPPLGAGEAASSPVAAALGNAVFDASGVRVRSVPFTRERLRPLFT
jgi:CO/xanthine dehydrogenase Mo-binding subunit